MLNIFEERENFSTIIFDSNKITFSGNTYNKKHISYLYITNIF